MVNFYDGGRKSEEYQFMDSVISEWFELSGPDIFVYKYMGVLAGDVDEDGNPITDVQADNTSGVVAQIQDVVFMENRDRKYDLNVICLRGVFQTNEYEWSMSQFGSMLSGDTLVIEFHINDMLARVGRKLIPGDVLELPNFRDDALLSTPGKAVNKFYNITEAKRSANGYQATWLPHIWRVRCEPMKASQEVSAILNASSKNIFGIDTGSKLADLVSNAAAQTGVNEAVVEQAQEMFLRRNFETRQYWIVPGDNSQSAWIFAGDGAPPDGAVLSGSGGDWPENPQVDDYFLRTDVRPNSLYQYTGEGWRFVELNYRQIWTAASRLMMEFINNRDTVTFNDGTQQASRQDLYKVVKPSADYGADDPLPGDAQDFPGLNNP